jgi:Uma2 family endonuclease
MAAPTIPPSARTIRSFTAPPPSDEDFLALLDRYNPLHIEYDAVERQVILIPGTDPWTGVANTRIIRQLGNWAEEDGRGEVTDSTTEFTLANGSRREPDAAWFYRSRLPARRSKGWPTFCPDFVIELRSPHDRPARLHRKMQEYIDNGAQLGWLIDPFENRVTIYRPGREPEVLDKPLSVAGEGPVDGFVLDLTRIWES